jgi:hypothetical protein
VDVGREDDLKRYAAEFARKGGKARAKRLTAKERSESARKAVMARWAKARKEKEQ